MTSIPMPDSPSMERVQEQGACVTICPDCYAKDGAQNSMECRTADQSSVFRLPGDDLPLFNVRFRGKPVIWFCKVCLNKYIEQLVITRIKHKDKPTDDTAIIEDDKSE